MIPNAPKKQITWLDTGAGPFIVVPRRIIAHWMGVKPRRPDQATDYDRACAVDGYIDLVRAGRGHGLVLGDEPFETTWWPLHSVGGGILVRHLWGDQTELLRAIPNVSEDAWTSEPIVFDAMRGDLVLFDAACPGEAIHDGLNIGVGPGEYAVFTANLEHGESCGMLHRLLPLL